MSILVDFHSHVLPCADHGSDGMETSKIQISYAVKNGVDRIIATPHFYPHVHTLIGFRSRVKSAYKTLKEYASENGVVLKLGAEVLLCNGLERLPGLEKLCFKGTRYLLVELPFLDFTNEYVETVSRLNSMGYKVILAHADRYPQEHIEQMLSHGASMLQINANSISSIFKRKHIFEWIANGYVGMIGSDIHGRDGSAYRHFVSAHKKLEGYLDILRHSSDLVFSQISD